MKLKKINEIPLDWTEMRNLKGGETEEPTGAPTGYRLHCVCAEIPGEWYSNRTDVLEMIEEYCGEGGGICHHLY